MSDLNKVKTVPERKRCPRCGEIKELKYFNKAGAHSDGRSTNCKKCNREASKKYKQDKGTTYCGFKNDIF